MRVDDKQLQSNDLDLEEQKTRQPHLEAEDDLELREIASEEVIDADRGQAGVLLEAMSAIMDKRSLVVSSLQLPQREREALEYLQAAVGGIGTYRGSFVFASDRRDLLEQALAVLQPNLTNLDPAVLGQLNGGYHALVEHVASLRDRLSSLEDAQDDLLDVRLELPDLTKVAPDDDDVDVKPEPSSLSNGPARPEPNKPPTTLEGATIAEEPFVSTLYEETPKRG